jgi:hypothetical protein
MLLPMIKHIVLWNVTEKSDGMDKAAIIARMKEMIVGMKESVPGIQEIEFGTDFNRSDAAFDVALYSSFADRNALDEYQRHPEHEKVKRFIGAVTTARAVVDYEL